MSSLGTIWAELGLKLNKFDEGLRQAEAKIKQAEASLKGFQKAGERLSDIGAKLTTRVALPIAALGAAAIKSSIDLEDAFTGVRKTVDATEEELLALQQGFEDMARQIPIAIKELYGIGEAAGQLGIKTENILGFTEVMAKLGVTTNLSSEQAAIALARLANITQMPQTQFDRLGATVVALGNNLSTSEAEIVEMGLRLAGAGKQIGLTEAQILALAGALSSVGIEAEAGGSAVSRVMIEIANAIASGNEKLTMFASVAGMSASEFARAFKEDAASALITFIEGLGRVSASGQNTFAVLDELGLSEIRVRDALLRAANAGDLFRQSMEIGNRAWQENIALNREAELRFGTLKSQFQLLINDLQLMAKSFGEQIKPALEELLKKYVRPAVQWVTNLDDSTKKFILTIAGIVAVVGPAIWILGQFFQAIVSIRAGIAVVTPLITTLAAKLSLAGAASTAAIAGLGIAFKTLLGPVGLIAAGITGLIFLFKKLKKGADEGKEGLSDFEAEMRRMQEEMQKEMQEEMKRMQEEMKKAQESIDSVGNAATRTASTVVVETDRVKTAVMNLQDRISSEAARIDTSIEIVRTKFELLAAQLDPVKDKTDILTASLEAQKAELALIEQKIAELSSGYECMKVLKGENAEETQKLYLELLREQKAWADLQKEIAKTEEEFRKAADASKQAASTEMVRAQQRKYLEAGNIKAALELQRVLEPGFKPPERKEEPRQFHRRAQSIAEQIHKATGKIVDYSALVAAMREQPGASIDELRSAIGLASGGILMEPVVGWGLRSGAKYAFAEKGIPEAVVPLDRGVPIDYKKFAHAVAQAISRRPQILRAEVHVHANDIDEVRKIIMLFERLPQVARAIGG